MTSGEYCETLLYSHWDQLKLHGQVLYDLTRCRMGAPRYYLTLAYFEYGTTLYNRIYL